MEDKEKFMKEALRQAAKAEKNEEIPIGAVIVKDGKIIAHAYNKREKSQIATHHAEILAIEKACKKLKSWRLDDCEMYVTLEPCPMCAGAICNARLKGIYFGAYEKKSGSVSSKFNILKDSGLNYNGQAEGGLLEEQCSFVLKDFFKKRRK